MVYSSVICNTYHHNLNLSMRQMSVNILRATTYILIFKYCVSDVGNAYKSQRYHLIVCADNNCALIYEYSSCECQIGIFYFSHNVLYVNLHICANRLYEYEMV